MHHRNDAMAAKSKSNAARISSQPRGRAVGSSRKLAEVGATAHGPTYLEMVRRRYGLSRKLFACMLGVSEATWAKWKAGSQLSSANLGRVLRVARILRKLERSVRRDYIATWLEQPSKACADLGVSTPADLFARRDYDAIEDMIFFLGSGVAF
jgi:DNA-binding transcriptional regulator YiaG